jgi:hypothetical protein
MVCNDDAVISGSKYQARSIMIILELIILIGDSSAARQDSIQVNCALTGLEYANQVQIDHSTVDPACLEAEGKPCSWMS